MFDTKESAGKFTGILDAAIKHASTLVFVLWGSKTCGSLFINLVPMKGGPYAWSTEWPMDQGSMVHVLYSPGNKFGVLYPTYFLPSGPSLLYPFPDTNLILYPSVKLGIFHQIQIFLHTFAVLPFLFSNNF